MLRSKFALTCAAAVAATALASAANAATYMPVGPQVNVALSTVTNGSWTQCFSEAYGSSGTSFNSILSACGGGGNLMLAGRATGSDTLLVLAQAPLTDVTFGTSGNATHNANGTEWYFRDGWSWGFAPGGETVTLNSCDTTNQSSPDRLCWHAGVGVLEGGWRVGSNVGLNNSSDFERLIFVNNGGGAVPEPATWALMLAGFFGAGSVLRRRRTAVTA
jgi:hypothetical protein